MYKILNNILEMDDYSLQRLSKSSKLPSEYQQVEYIESTGTQYIDTGIKTDIDIAIESVMKVTSRTNELNYSGAVYANSEGWIAFGSYALGKLVSYFASKNRIGVEINFDNNFHKYYLKNGLQTIDDLSAQNTISSIPNTLNIYLFKGNINFPTNFAMKQIIKYCKIWKNDVVVRDFIPCYRKSDNVIGLYDLVSNTFFTNDGTGKFTYGSTSLALSTPFGDKGIEDRTNDLSFTDFNNWESEQYDINENKDIEETEQIKAPNIISDMYTSITADTEVQPNQVDFIPKAIDENKASEPNVKDWVENEEE